MNALVRACRRLWRWAIHRIAAPDTPRPRRPSDRDPAWRDPNAEVDTRAGGSVVCWFCRQRRDEEVVVACERGGPGRVGCVAARGGER